MLLEELQSNFEHLQSSIASGPVTPSVQPEEVRSYLRRYDFSEGVPLDTLVRDMEELLSNWQVQVTHPRYFGLFNPSVTLASVAAETLVAMYNPQLANWRTSPAANEIERHILLWLTEKFGLPPETSVSFTTGGSEANLSAVVVALTKHFPSYGKDGLHSLPRLPVIYLTKETHHSFSKIAHITGLGRHALRTIPSDASFRMDVASLRQAVSDDRDQGFEPFMVVGTAGTTAAAAIDPLEKIGEFCQQTGLWFHVDAAWGGAAIISARLAPYLNGIQIADSITCDAHKWFSVPMGCGMFFCRHPDTVAEAFRSDVSYMPKKIETAHGNCTTSDPFTTTVQWSRRFIGLKLFMTIAHLGEAGCVQMIDHQARMGDLLREVLLASGWRIVNSSPLPLVCFTRDGLTPSTLLALLREHQVAWMSEAELNGIPVIRACITSHRTVEADIRWVVKGLTELFSQTVVDAESCAIAGVTS